MKILYIDADDTIFKYKQQLKKYQELYPDLEYVQSTPDFFYTLEPFQDAIESIKKLMKYYDVYILTAPSYMNPLSYTEKRLSFGKHFGNEFCKKLIICSNKGLLKGDFLVDDLAFGKGQEGFDGELIQYGTDKFPDWITTFNYLKAKYENE